MLPGVLSASDKAIFEAEPGWIIPTVIPESTAIPYEQVQNGAHYLNFDRQILVPETGEPQYFYRYVTTIVNQSGLDDQSQINIAYDPVFESVNFHKLNIVRNGETISILKSATIRYLQQEEDLDRQLYNGETTLNILIEDLRVNDVLDYSYTIEGSNPVFDNKFNAWLKLQWNIPISFQHLRLIWQKEGPLNYKIINTDLSLKRTTTSIGIEYSLSQVNVDPLRIEDNSPSWVDPYAKVQFSEQDSWESVAEWGTELFAKSIGQGPDIEAVAETIRKSSNSHAERIAGTLRYVQQEIRYVGIELGENSHRPTSAGTTLSRRYGDCKDKATLMVSILAAMDIEAYPALVNTYDKNQISNFLPSMTVFDHVIVAIPDKNRILWLDPTRLYQKGNIDHIYQPDYGQALVLNKNSTNLVSMSNEGIGSGYYIYERFNLLPDASNIVKLKVNTEYFGASAERTINRFESNDLKQIEIDYLDFYNNYYPGIEVNYVEAKGVDPESYRFKVEESYDIEEFWTTESGSDRKVGWVYSSSINSLLEEPEEKSRVNEYHLAYPWKVNHSIILALPDKQWDFADDNFLEDNPFFTFSRNAKYTPDSNTFYVDFSYESKRDHVKPAEFSDYVEALKKVSSKLDYGFYSPEENQSPDFDSYYFGAVLSAYLSLIILSVFLWYRDVKSNRFSADMLYYPISQTKFLYMWALTAGLFPVYWFYKNWQFEKTYRATNGIMPMFRGLFYQFWYYPLYKNLKLNFSDKLRGSNYPPTIVAAILAILLFVSVSTMGYLDILFTPLLILNALLAIPLLNMVNTINDEEGKALAYNSRWSSRHFLLAIIFIPILILADGSSVGLLPSNSVVTGDKILNHDLKFLQRANIINPSEKIVYFYSDAMWTIRDDGNGFTDRHVFSYWRDEDGKFRSETILFNEIDDYKITWSKGFFENTILELYRIDQSKVVLYLSSEASKDKLFINGFKQRRKQ